MSPRWNWDSPTPLSRKRVCPPPKTRGRGGGTRLRERGWEIPTTGEKSLAICRLCGVHYTVSSTVWKLISMYRTSFDVKTFPIECGCIQITLGGNISRPSHLPFVLILSEEILSLIWIFLFTAVLRIRIWIRIRRLCMFLGLLDPDLDPLVRGMDPDLDPSIIKQK